MNARPTHDELEAARGRTLRDIVAKNLQCLFVGINPSLYSAAVGHHFARPGNRFWPALYRSGFTDRQLSPEEDSLLLEYGCGVTNVVARATARADELAPEEFRKGAKRLERLARQFRPSCLIFVGVTAYRTAHCRPRARLGLQAELIANTPVWVVPNTSGLNAHYQLDDFAKLLGEVKAFLHEMDA